MTRFGYILLDLIYVDSLKEIIYDKYRNKYHFLRNSDKIFKLKLCGYVNTLEIKCSQSDLLFPCSRPGSKNFRTKFAYYFLA